MMTSRQRVLNMYRSLLRESQKIPAYNFRNYALRKVRDSFKANKVVNDDKFISDLLADAQKNLDIIKRQASIGQMYQVDKLVIEKVAVTGKHT